MINEMLTAMIDRSNGNLYDITHLLKVHAYARLIGQQEQLPADKQFILEAAAVIHDISCPLCRQKYGNTNHKMQEQESPVLVQEFLKPYALTAQQAERIEYLVSHHHTYEPDDLDYQILLEADYLVNAQEKNYDQKKAAAARSGFFKTPAGTHLLESLFQI